MNTTAADCAPTGTATPLLVTPHGSRLYGLAHAHSDHDTYRVLPQDRTRLKYKQVTQRMTGSQDALEVGLSTWLAMCDDSTPQVIHSL